MIDAKAVIVSWLPCVHDNGMTGYLTVPMSYGVELVKITPMDSPGRYIVVGQAD